MPATMRTIALINQKGGVGKTTTAVNLGAALAEAGRRVVLVDLDPQANLTLHLGLRLEPDAPTSYRVLLGEAAFADAIHATETERLSAVPTDIDLSGAELELASAFGRETLLRDALADWVNGSDGDPADYVLLDCPPSLGLLSVNGLAAADEVFLPVQTEFFALQGLTKLMDTVALVQRRLHPGLEIGGIIGCLYDSRLRLAREVLGEVRNYFPGRVFKQAIGTNVKLAEAPSFGQTILQYAPESAGARDYRALAAEVIAQEAAAAETAAAESQEPEVAETVSTEPKDAEPSDAPAEVAATADSDAPPDATPAEPQDTNANGAAPTNGAAADVNGNGELTPMPPPGAASSTPPAS